MSIRKKLIAFVGLIVASCGGQAAPTTTIQNTSAPISTTTVAETSTTANPGFTVTSADGDVEVRVPPEAAAEDPGITIRLLAPEEYPPELAASAEIPGTKIYSLEPDGLTFDAPVLVTRRIPIENFGELSASEVPVVYLLTRNPDGEYALLDELQDLRNGDFVEVSGETPHFSPLVSVYGQVRLEVAPEPSHSRFSSEVATATLVDIFFSGDDGESLTAPDSTEPYGGWHSDYLELDQMDGMTRINCVSIGDARPRIGSWVDFRIDPAPGQAGLSGPPALIPGLESARVLVNVEQPFQCLDPKTSLVGAPVAFTYEVDHPGGDVVIPDADFKGGLSGLYATLADSGAFTDSRLGLIGDVNHNGRIDLNDSMFEMQQKSSGGPATVDSVYVLPLFGYGWYFPYVVDGDSYPDLPAWDSRSMTVGEGLDWLASLFDGEGRFETSLGVVGMDGEPMTIEVGSSETSGESEGSISSMINYTVSNAQFP